MEDPVGELENVRTRDGFVSMYSLPRADVRACLIQQRHDGNLESYRCRARLNGGWAGDCLTTGAGVRASQLQMVRADHFASLVSEMFALDDPDE